jgi:hypothetical protein
VNVNGKIVANSNVNASAINSTEGGTNFGTGKDISGKLFNTTGLSSIFGTIGSTTAVIGGVISSTNAITTSIGVIYSTDINFGTYSTTTIQSNVAAGSYSSTISGLNSSTTYFAKSFIVNKAGTSYGPTINFSTPVLPLTVGTSYQGGKIFYIFQPGEPGYVAGQTHGLIAATSDQGSGAWGCYGSKRTTSELLGSGSTNTATIIGGCGQSDIAARRARAHRGGNYEDWYLPSKEELYKLYLERNSIGGFNGTYWSSSEAPTGSAPYYAYYYNFSAVTQDTYNWQDKNSGYSVRAIRTF